MSAERTLAHVPVMGANHDEYLYVGNGDQVVLLCEYARPGQTLPRWRNALGLTPAAARLLAEQLLWQADQAERHEGGAA